MFPRLILDAPDVPTWFFADTVTRCTSTHGAKVLHLFNHLDKAVEAGRLRRAITGVYPGNGLVLPTTWPLPDHLMVTAVAGSFPSPFGEELSYVAFGTYGT